MFTVQYIDRTPFHHEIIGLTAAAVVRLNANYRNHRRTHAVFLTVEGNNIRYWINGQDPTIVQGHIVYATGNLYLNDPKAIRELRMISTGGNATVMVTYYR